MPTTAKKPRVKKAREPEITLTDPSNRLLALGPSVMSCGLMDTEEGKRLILTIRTSSTTLSIALTEDEAAAWRIELGKKAREMAQEAEAEAS